jgi:ribonuclease Z
MQRLVQAGVRVNAVNKLFLTHLHSDHVIDVPDLLLMGWSATPARSVPLEVWGPEGTRDMMTHLEQAFAFDIHMRRDVDEHHPPAGIQVVAHDVREGAVYATNAVRITAFLVDHGPVQPAYGYRLDFGGHSVCLSGDTRPSQNLVDKCHDVDVLIHEVIDAELVRRSVPNARVAESIIAHHTTADQAADVFQRAHPRLAVFSHLQPASAVLERARRLYRGRLEEGDDLMTIDVGSEIVVKRPPPGSAGRS